jgi:WD40 repeat protein
MKGMALAVGAVWGLTLAGAAEPAKRHDAAPRLDLRADHMVLDAALSGPHVLLATQSGRVQAFDWRDGASLPPLLELIQEGDRIHPPAVLSVAVSPDGARVAAAVSDGTVRVLAFEASAGSPRRVMANGVQVCRFLDDGRLALGDMRGDLAVVDLTDGREVFRRQLEYDPVYAVAIAPDGGRIAVGFRSSRIQIVDAESGETLQSLSGHRDAVNDLAWHGPRGLVSGGKDKRVLYWDLGRPGSPWRELHHGDRSVTALAVDPDGARLAATLDGPTIGMLSLPDGGVVGRLAGHSAPVHVLAFADEGRLLISGGNDARVLVWDVSSSALPSGEGGDG